MDSCRLSVTSPMTWTKLNKSCLHCFHPILRNYCPLKRLPDAFRRPAPSVQMGFLSSFFVVFCAVVLLAQGVPFRQSDLETSYIQKRLSNDALIRLMMRNRPNTALNIKRNTDKRSDVERRSFDDDFSNCFLSPVQCMLPNSRK
ncbi:unnamed protein product [Caenorhabditis auriculariae]|uniref:Uncharacterized protein n=1 Tax=Caenorhabditis auriculariae TaxID=2777116 RepID=A0A8S1GQW8_9PELO|nr:unnamed protein product [Caenorhabditis auriculariae]